RREGGEKGGEERIRSKQMESYTHTHTQADGFTHTHTHTHTHRAEKHLVWPAQQWSVTRLYGRLLRLLPSSLTLLLPTISLSLLPLSLFLPLSPSLLS